MKVNNSLSGNIANVDQTKTDKSNSLDTLRNGSKEANGVDFPARIELSDRAQQIRKAKELATPADTVDEEKVARIQKLIDEGRYQIDAGAIADKMVDEHLLMSE